MKRILIFLIPLIVLTFWTCKQSTKEQIQFEPNWESLEQYQVPEWFRDAKFGIYTHWGAYSVPRYENEWYPRLLYMKDDEGRGKEFYEFHKKTYGDPSVFGYKDLIPLFTADKFNAEEWADLFEKSGARFAGPVAEHHDGFAMWDSKLTPWNAKNMGPKRDIVGELAEAVRAKGMRFVTSFHHAFHWKYYEPSYLLENPDTKHPEFCGVDKIYPPLHDPGDPASEEFLQMWLDKIKEVVDNYQPDYLWFDFGWVDPEFEPYKQEFLAYYYNQAIKWKKEVVVTYKHDHLPPGVAVLDLERGKLDTLSSEPWITDTSVDFKSWSYIDKPLYKPINMLVDNLVDRVSKNGNLLLNIGPHPDGSIPEEQRELLLGIGSWLQVNGEAIYESRPWKIFGEGPTKQTGGYFSEEKDDSYTANDIRFTTKENAFYIIALDWPEEGKVFAESLDYNENIGEIKKISMLGSKEEIGWTRDELGLTLYFPEEKPCEHAFVFKLEL